MSHLTYAWLAVCQRLLGKLGISFLFLAINFVCNVKENKLQQHTFVTTTSGQEATTTNVISICMYVVCTLKVNCGATVEYYK